MKCKRRNLASLSISHRKTALFFKVVIQENSGKDPKTETGQRPNCITTWGLQNTQLWKHLYAGNFKEIKKESSLAIVAVKFHNAYVNTSCNSYDGINNR